jgi:hypothetical protein
MKPEQSVSLSAVSKLAAIPSLSGLVQGSAEAFT